MFQNNKTRAYWILLLIVFTVLPFLQVIPQSAEASSYSYGHASPDGTGKYYMGREISQVMGHRGARWLERPEREQERQHHQRLVGSG